MSFLVIAYPPADKNVRRYFIRTRDAGDEGHLAIAYYGFMEALFTLAISELTKALVGFPVEVGSIPLRWKRYLAQDENQFEVGPVRRDFYECVREKAEEVSGSR